MLMMTFLPTITAWAKQLGAALQLTQERRYYVGNGEEHSTVPGRGSLQDKS